MPILEIGIQVKFHSTIAISIKLQCHEKNKFSSKYFAFFDIGQWFQTVCPDVAICQHFDNFWRALVTNFLPKMAKNLAIFWRLLEQQKL